MKPITIGAHPKKIGFFVMASNGESFSGYRAKFIPESRSFTRTTGGLATPSHSKLRDDSSCVRAQSLPSGSNGTDIFHGRVTSTSMDKTPPLNLAENKPETREEFLYRFRHAKPEWRKFEDPGTHVGIDGKPYKFDGNEVILEIAGMQVMAKNSERPWADMNTDKAVQTLQSINGDMRRLETIDFLVVGAGLHLTANNMLTYLMHLRRGNLTVVDINLGVLEDTEAWKADWLKVLNGIGIKDINIDIVDGDSTKVIRQFRERERKFLWVDHDTVPGPGEQGLNDFVSIEDITHILDKKGVFTFFPFHDGWRDFEQQDKIAPFDPRQSRIIKQYFKGIVTGQAEVRPHPEYKYLCDKDGRGIRDLPVGGGYDPKELFAA